MIDLTHIFGSEAKQALDNAREYQRMSASERYEATLALAEFTRSLMQSRDGFRDRLRLYEQSEREEMYLLLGVQRRRHV